MASSFRLYLFWRRTRAGNDQKDTEMTGNNLLEPGNHALLLIDHQYLQLLTLRSHEAGEVINNVTAVAKAANIFNVPTLLTTAFAEKQELINKFRTSSPIKSPWTVRP
jgi:nicotinamidase-related amidase